VLALVLPGEAMPPPHIRPAIAAAGFLRALLKGEPVAMRIRLGRGFDPQQAAERDEMTLGAAALLEGAVAPEGDKFGDVSGSGHFNRLTPHPLPHEMGREKGA